MYNNKNKTKGFSLIELLLSISILFILFTLVNHGFLKKQRGMEFEIASDNLYNQLYEAREYSRNFKNGTVYWVHLETDKYEWFEGYIYSATGVIATSELPGFLEINSIALNGGGNNIIFEKNTGKTQNYWVLKLNSNNGQVVKFEINKQGLISVNDSN